MLPKTPKLTVCLILVFLFCWLTQAAVAASSVVINEIAWAGTTENWRQEWIELFNGSGSVVDITGWQIENAGASNKTLVLSAGQIAANGYFLICRAELPSFAEATAGAASCDLVETKLSLHNEYSANGKLVLRDNIGNVIDATPEANDTAWPGGDNTTKQTMEKTNTGWQTSAEPNGTPKAANSIVQAPEAAVLPVSPPEPPTQPEPPQLPLPEPESEPEQTPEPIAPESQPEPPPEPQPINYPTGIYINEIMPSPEGADAEEEWLELYNANDFEVDLAGWQIKDKIGAIKTYICPAETILSASGFLVIKRPESNITLQNSGDELALLNPAGEIIDLIAYPASPQGLSYARQGESWAWTITLTPGQANIIMFEVGPQAIGQAPPASQTNEKTLSQTVQGKALAQTSQGLSVKSNQLLTLIIAIAIALASAIAVLLLNKKLRQTE